MAGSPLLYSPWFLRLCELVGPTAVLVSAIVLLQKLLWPERRITLEEGQEDSAIYAAENNVLNELASEDVQQQVIPSHAIILTGLRIVATALLSVLASNILDRSTRPVTFFEVGIIFLLVLQVGRLWLLCVRKTSALLAGLTVVISIGQVISEISGNGFHSSVWYILAAILQEIWMPNYASLKMQRKAAGSRPVPLAYDNPSFISGKYVHTSSSL